MKQQDTDTYAEDTVALNMFSISRKKYAPMFEYFDQNYRSPISYLRIELYDDKSRRLVAGQENRLHELQLAEKTERDKRLEIENYQDILSSINSINSEKKRIIKQIHEIEDNTRKKGYQLNTRGLILYVLGEIEQQNSEIENENGKRKRNGKKKRVYNKRISKVMKNLYETDVHAFSFLNFYDYFRDRYEMLKGVEKLSIDYEVELLKKIALELQYIVHDADLDLLQYWVTRRYSGEIMYHIVSLIRSGLLFVPLKELLLLRDYQLLNLHAMKVYLSPESKRIDKAYEILSSSFWEQDLQIYV